MNSFKPLCVLLLAAGMAPAQQYVISTVAGVPLVQGYFGDDDVALSAQLYKPQRVAVDTKGNFYMSDYYIHAVRMVTASTGKISRIAGNGTRGFAGDDGPGRDANITDVHGIAVDSTGVVYISDTANNRVRKIDTKGVITTIAGNGTPGYSGDGAAGGKAQMWFPAGLAVDGSGNVYATDYGNSTVRKITSAGIVSTVAGTGTWGSGGDGAAANKAALANPMSVAVDAAGNVFIGDVGNNTIRRVGTDGIIRTVATGVTPQSLAVDPAGNLYFVDGLSSTVQKILPSGTTLTISGTGRAGFSGDGGQSTLAQMDHPAGLALDAAGKIYVADSNNQVIRLLTPVPFSVGSVTSAASASVQGGIAPGEIVTIYGTGIGPATLTQFSVSNGTIGPMIAGTQVSMNGFPAPLVYVSSNLIAAIAPYALASFATADVVVQYNGNTSSTTTVPVVQAAPAIFTADATGGGQAAAVNQDGSLNSAAKPARAGSFISLYITGDGQSNPGGVDGKLANAAPYPQTVLPVKVTVGGVSAVVSYAGATPTAVAGLTQVNVQIPATVAAGGAVPVTVTVGGVAAQSGVTLAVQ
jgi:uncharacterized protein (TIGR03437 family)